MTGCSGLSDLSCVLKLMNTSQVAIVHFQHTIYYEGQQGDLDIVLIAWKCMSGEPIMMHSMLGNIKYEKKCS